ncbi:unnamed protein product [Brassicogethes aeneus]|uniref:Uncharacterized protein n=1 Tax=Brassicogethes aeneus TaxID=1431903 RepID=A0A9P0FAR6_BRAAE|nr:unnamed protein product [Brassicogethes aeneus]
MKLLLLLCFVVLSQNKETPDCDKNMDFHEETGYGYDTICKSLSNANINLLEDIVISNEYSLVIQDSVLEGFNSSLFGNIANIKKLEIVNSKFTMEGKDMVFEKLKLLKQLSVRQTKFQASAKTFFGLASLRELELDGNDLDYVEVGAFGSIEDLRVLKITNNHLKHIRDLPLCEIKNLNILNLKKNLIPTLKYYSFSCNKHRETIGLSLNDDKLDVGIRGETYMNTSETFTNIVSVNFNYNKITEIGFALADLKGLRDLEFEGNLLEIIRADSFEPLNKIEKLNFKNNRIRIIEDQVLFNKPYLTKLNLAGNQISRINLNSTTSLEYLNLANNKLVLASLSILSNLKSLKELIISDNHISEVLPNEFRNFTSLVKLDVSGNKLVLRDESFSDLYSLLDLNLSRNSIKTLPSHVFQQSLQLKSIDLSHNVIYKFPELVFSNLTDLETLNLSYNKIVSLPYVLFKNLVNLNVLDVAGNRLKSLQYDLMIDNLPSLSLINFKHNSLSCQFLSKIISFIKKKNISYTITEKFQYDKENVEGISCEEEDDDPPKGDIKPHPLKSESSGTSTWAVLLIVGAVMGVLGFGTFKLAMFVRRRRYTNDQFELIHS